MTVTTSFTGASTSRRIAASTRIKFALHNSSGKDVLYAAVLGPDATNSNRNGLLGVFRGRSAGP